MSDTREIVFKVPGPPQFKRRHRSAIIAGHVATYSDKRTVQAEEAVRLYFLQAAGGDWIPHQGPVHIEIVALFALPKSTPRWKLQAAVPISMTTKPDADNVLKMVLDGLKGVAMKDDNQVQSMKVQKVYTTEMPCIEVKLRFLPSDPRTLKEWNQRSKEV